MGLNLFVLRAVVVPAVAAAVPQQLVDAIRPDGPAGCTTWLVTDERRHACFVDEAHELLKREGTGALASLDRLADEHPHELGPACHGHMHEVGRRMARSSDPAQLARLMPSSGDPNCAAGFTHGMLTALGAGGGAGTSTEQVAALCAQQPARPTRLACVHGLGHTFMRQTGADLDQALELCSSAVGAQAPDCAAGAFHDYEFGLDDFDDARRPDAASGSPERVCGSVADQFVRPCWFRLLDPPDRPTASKVERRCGELSGVQRDGCIAAVIAGSTAADFGLGVCERLADVDAVSCLHGISLIKDDQLSSSDASSVQRCAGLRSSLRNACYERLAHVLVTWIEEAAVTTACRSLEDPTGRAACARGVARREESLRLR